MAITSFIPELWSARLLSALEKNLVAAKLVNRDYEGEIRNAGDTVHINTIGEITVSSYTANSDINNPQVLTTDDQTLEIDQQKYFNFQIDDVDAAQAAGTVMDKAMQRAAYKLAEAADAYLLGVIADAADSDNTIGTTAAPIELSSSNIYENLLKLRVMLDKANVPTVGRSVVVPPEVYALLLNDTNHFAVVQPATGEDAIVNGFVGRAAGFDVYMSNNCVYDSTDKYWTITAQVPAATTYAEQVVKTEAYRLEKRFADGVRGLHVYGAKVVDSAMIAALIATLDE